jgi:hypothetical protein
MTEFRESGKSNLDAGESGNGRGDVPVDVAMEMATAATSIATETAGATIFEPMERIKNGIWGRSSEAPVAPSDRSCWMERTISQQAQELMGLHQTGGHLAKVAGERAVHEEARPVAMTTGMQERERTWDTRYEDDKLWGQGS